MFINHLYIYVEILYQNNQQLKIIHKTKNQKSRKLLIKIWSFLLKCEVLCSEHHVNIQFPGICRVDRYLSIDELNIFKPRIEKFSMYVFLSLINIVPINLNAMRIVFTDTKSLGIKDITFHSISCRSFWLSTRILN